MPSIRDYKGNQKHNTAEKIGESEGVDQVKSHRQRRRPGREPGEINQGEFIMDGKVEVKAEVQTEFEGIFDDSQPEHVVHPDFHKQGATEHQEEDTVGRSHDHGSKKTHLEFPYSDILRSRAPKAFELAETVVDEWAKDGTFEGLPVGHPLAQVAVGFGLRKAKNVEKKLEEKGVFAMAKIGIELVKSKLNRKD